MIVVCMICGEVLRVIGGRGVSHGYCTFCGLEALVNDHLATPYERLRHFLYKWNLEPAVMVLCLVSVGFLALSVAGIVGGQ